jgi:hypothetical protein
LTPTGRLEKRTHAPQQNALSFNHVVSASDQSRRQSDIERLRDLRIDV